MEEEPWVIPTGQLDDISIDLGIDVLAEAEISTALSSLNAEIRKKGISVLDGPHQFRVFFSAIYHYQSSNDAIRNVFSVSIYFRMFVSLILKTFTVINYGTL